MKKEDIIELLREFDKSSLTVLDLKNEGFELSLKKKTKIVKLGDSAVENIVYDFKPEESESVKSENFYVEAPLVASFYRAPSPESDPFIEIGDYVQKGQVLFILEAMKMINEIKSPVSGRVVNIFPKNGELVQFGDRVVEIEAEDV